MAASDVLLDPGVLLEREVLEIGGTLAVASVGGRAVLRWRGSHERARVAGIAALATTSELGDARFSQAVVHLSKSRDATWEALADAWSHLDSGGRLLLCGPNNLGIKSAVSRLARELGQSALVVVSRAHSRVAAFVRDAGPGPVRPPGEMVDVALDGGGALHLVTAPGLFSADALDRGTALLLGQLAGRPPARRVADLGCGAGPLGLAALMRWPGCAAILADADAQAVDCARVNAVAAGVAERCEVLWWDAAEGPPARDCDLVLCNPPFHSEHDRAVDLEMARTFLEAVVAARAPGGTALIVANVALPYARRLRGDGHAVRVVARESGYDVLAVE